MNIILFKISKIIIYPNQKRVNILKMLSEEQFFQAKTFLRLYKDTLTCVEQVWRKKYLLDHDREYFEILKQGHINNQIVFNKDGNLERGENIRSHIYFRYFELVE